MTIARRTEKYIATAKHGRKLLRKETQEMIAEALRPVKKEANK
jgi:hypothetical protein